VSLVASDLDPPYTGDLADIDPIYALVAAAKSLADLFDQPVTTHLTFGGFTLDIDRVSQVIEAAANRNGLGVRPIPEIRNLRATVLAAQKALLEPESPIYFSRYEVWRKADLFSERLLYYVGTDLAEAQHQGDLAATGERLISIDYISLHHGGRTERSWVREIDTGIWKELGAPSVDPPSF
jgi:hypothetical protein